MKDLYNRNSEFRGYVDRYCKKYMEGKSITIEQALEHKIVRDVAEQYREMEKKQND